VLEQCAHLIFNKIRQCRLEHVQLRVKLKDDALGHADAANGRCDVRAQHNAVSSKALEHVANDVPKRLRQRDVGPAVAAATREVDVVKVLVEVDGVDALARDGSNDVLVVEQNEFVPHLTHTHTNTHTHTHTHTAERGEASDTDVSTLAV
jgi:hypothetical protein